MDILFLTACLRVASSAKAGDDASHFHCHPGLDPGYVPDPDPESIPNVRDRMTKFMESRLSALAYKPETELIFVDQIFFPHFLVVAQSRLPAFTDLFLRYTCDDLLAEFGSTDLYLDRTYLVTEL